MRRKRVSRDDCYPRDFTGQRALHGYKKRQNPENVVVIDGDGDESPEVVIIDLSDSFEANLRGCTSSRVERKVSHNVVISIDDEDSDVDHSGAGMPRGSELDSDATSSKRSFPSPDIPGNPVDFDVDQCHTVQKDNSSLKVPKWQKSSTRRSYVRCSFGLYTESEDSFGSDHSDCEVLEGSSEALREQWEKNYPKHKHEKSSRRHGMEDQASTSTFHAGDHMNIRGEYRDEPFAGEPIFSFSANDKAKEVLSRGNNCDQNSWNNMGSRRRGCFEPDQGTAWLRSRKFVSVNGDAHVAEEACTKKGPPHAEHENSLGSDKRNGFMGGSFEGKKTGNMEASSGGCPQSANNEEEASNSYSSQVSAEANIPEADVRDDDNLIFEEEFWGNSPPQDELLHEKATKSEDELPRHQSVSRASDSICTAKYAIDKDLMENSLSNCNAQVSHEGAREEKEHYMERSYSMKDQGSNVQSTSEGQSNNDNDSGRSPNIQDSLINGREKLKETDEYRRAQEEEWASRQQQLRLQAEEAQRLRKKKRAESMRVLDMERRQKERVEEIRKTQKKDEENMNLKEQIRAEIRKELLKLEMTCIDMPSLLCGLGIHVGSSGVPRSQEVHSAYKRALLRFHPDRASRNDIRQQVEAEEKFKLISRMKEKFPLTSCH